MKTKVKTIVATLFMLLIIGLSTKVQAASASIRASKTSATVGDSVTITVNINAAAWNLKVSGNGVSGGKIVGYDQEGNNTSTTKTYTLSTASAGTYTISLIGDVTDGATDVNSSINTSVTVKVDNPPPVTPVTPPTGGSSNGGSNSGSGNNSSSTNNKPSNNGGSSSSGGNQKPATNPQPEEKKSNDSSLKGLVIEGYELYPEFNTNTREYSLRVTNDITKVTVVPTVNDSKASYSVQGVTDNLIVGVNVITIVVKAEDGTTSNYVVNVNREREGLSVQYIKVFYTDEQGIRQELVLSPEFSTEVFEYTLNDLSYLVSKLELEVLANLEQAKIEVTGNEGLVEGANTITVTVTMPSDTEEADEVLTYKITVNKEKEPVVTLMGRIKNWFNGITGTVGTWFNENMYEFLTGSLIVCSVALVGLSIYLVLDYKKYKMMAEKIAILSKANSSETAVATNTSQPVDKATDNVESAKIETQDVKPKNKGKHS